MNPQRMQQIEKLYLEASELDENKRNEFLDEACGEDEELRKEIDSLLMHEKKTESFLEFSALQDLAPSLADTYTEDLEKEIEGTVGRYKILEKLGSGGMGRVYRAHDPHLDRTVALKVLPPGMIANKKLRPRFVREAKAASSLNHPNIITIYDIGQDGDIDFIAMEFVQGNTLRAILSKRALTLKETLDYAIQTAQALYAAHCAGIIHRDIKPENIMITDAPSFPGQVKILDFGLAKFTRLHQQAENDDVKSIRGAIFGTAAYMSPEQAEGKLLDARSDIFSIGAVLYEMQSKRKAFQGTTNLSILNAVIHYEPEPPAGIPMELWNIISCCLNKDPDLRFQDAHELESALVSCRPFIGTFSKRVGISGFPLGKDIKKSAKTMLVVLPFNNLSNDKEQDYFSDGLTEEMITELGRLNPDRLGVIARTTAVQVRSDGKGIADIGNELGVDYILEGSVRKVVDRVRITVQLIQAQDQTSLWTSTYDRHLQDILDIQQDVAKRTARSLAMELLPSEGTIRSHAGSRMSDAHELYLKGLYYWNLRTEENFRAAIQFLEKAIELDPGYTLAYSVLASAYITAGIYCTISPDMARNRAKEHARKALDIDPDLAEAHTALGYALLVFDWDWENSEIAFQSAIRNNPNYIGGHHWYSFMFALLGKFHKAEEQMDVAVQLDPISYVTNTHKGWIYYFARRYQDAAEQLHYAIRLNADFALSHYFLGLTYLQMGKLEDSIQEFNEARKLSGNHPAACAGLGYLQGVRGRKQEALRFLAELSRLAVQRHVSPYFYSWICQGLGRTDEAVKQLEKAYNQRCPWMAHLNVDPMMDPLRSDSKFQGILKRIGFPQ